MDAPAFFAAIRRAPFPGRLTQQQVDGINALIAAFDRHGLDDLHHRANVLAQTGRETGLRMAPVRETFADSDGEAIARLDRAFAAGRLPWVRAPYWRTGYFGRGMIQITHEANYLAMGARLGIDLVRHPELALDPAISADIAVIGMRDGVFTGRRLEDYDFPAALDYPPDRNPRRIVNGRDGSDAEVADYHRAFAAALALAA